MQRRTRNSRSPRDSEVHQRYALFEHESLNNTDSESRIRVSDNGTDDEGDTDDLGLMGGGTMWDVKALVAVLFATHASYYAYFSLMLQDKGFTASEMGMTFSFSELSALVGTFVWTSVAEQYNAQYSVLLSVCIGASVMCLLLGMASSVLWCTGIIIIYSFLSGPKGAMTDALILRVLKYRGETSRYGQQRLVGSVSFGACAVVIGMVLPARSYYLVPYITAFCTGLFVLVLIVVTVRSPAVLRGPPTKSIFTDGSVERGGNNMTGAVDVAVDISEVGGKEGNQCISDETRSSPRDASIHGSLKLYVRMLSNPGLSIPLLGAVLLVVAENIIGNFAQPYVRQVATTRKLPIETAQDAIAYTMAVRVVSESAVFMACPYLLERYAPTTLLSVSGLFFAAKMFGYSIVSAPSQILLIEAFHGFCYALMWSALVHHATETPAVDDGRKEGDRRRGVATATDEHKSQNTSELSAMSLLHLTCGGLAPFASGIIGGKLVDSVGYEILFRTCGVLCVGAALLIGSHRLLRTACLLS